MVEATEMCDDFYGDFLSSADPDAFILTLDGKMIKGIAQNEHELLANADAIQELMGMMMKEEDAKEGLWRWKIFDNWKSIEGWEH